MEKKKKDTLNYTALRNKLKQEGPGKLYVLWGAEDYLIADFVGRLRKACLGEGENEFDWKRIDGARVDENNLRDALDAMPFFSERTLVELVGFDVNKVRSDSMKKLFSDIPDWCTVVITMPTGVSPDGRLGFVRELKTMGSVLEFTPQDNAELYEWLTRRFRHYGKTIGRQEMDRLLFVSGDLMTRLIPEIEKICAYAKGEAVTVEDINATAHHIPEANAFEMTDCIAAGNYDGAFYFLSELMAGDGEDSDPLKVLGAIGSQMRNLYYVKTAEAAHLSESRIQELLGYKNVYRVRALSRIARNFSAEALAEDVRLCAETDYRMKTSSGSDPELLTELLVRFAMEGQRD